MAGQQKAKVTTKRIPVSPELASKISECMDRLRNGNPQQRKQAAARLFEVGIAERHSIGPRGTVGSSAPNRVPQPEIFEILLNCCADKDPSVRMEAASALGEWSDNQAVPTLARLLNDQPDEDQDVREACIIALKTIGGPDAVDQLARAAANAPGENTRLAALDALEELGAGGWVDVTDRQPPRPMSGSTTSAMKKSAVDMLTNLCADSTQRPFLRHRAKSTLKYLAWAISPKENLPDRQT